MNSISIKSNLKDYTAYFESDDTFLKQLAELANSVYIVDENVYRLHKDDCLKYLPKDRLIELEISEDRKNMDTVCELYEKIMQFAPRKNLNLVSIIYITMCFLQNNQI